MLKVKSLSLYSKWIQFALHKKNFFMIECQKYINFSTYSSFSFRFIFSPLLLWVHKEKGKKSENLKLEQFFSTFTFLPQCINLCEYVKEFIIQQSSFPIYTILYLIIQHFLFIFMIIFILIIAWVCVNACERGGEGKKD
jgi:hypothetical protein